MSTRDDKGFEELLARELTELPPDDEIVARTNSWEEPVTRIAMGLTLTTIKLNFLWLNYLLPGIGYLMLLLGFRALRRENRWFAAGWGLSLLRLAGWMCTLVEASTGWRGPEIENSLPLILLAVAIQAGYFLILRKALAEVFQKAEVPWERDPLLLLAGLTVAMAVLALSPLSNSWLAAIPTLGFYIYALNALYHLPEKLSDAGYALAAAPVAVSEKTVKWVYWLLCLAIVTAGSLYAAHIPLEAAPDTGARSAPVRQELLALGFPEEQLQDLPDSALEGLSGVLNLDVSQELLMFDPHSEPEYNSYGLVYQYVDAPGTANLDVTAVTAELPGHQFRTFLFFQWKSMSYGADHGPFWTDSFLFRPEESAGETRYTGALLYEKGGESWIAPIPELTMKGHTATGFFGTSNFQAITGRVNYPMGAENRRGWLQVDFTMPEDYWLGSMIFNWYRSGAPTFPHTDSMERVGSIHENRRQFYTTFQTLSRYLWEQAGEPEEWPPQ